VSEPVDSSETTEARPEALPAPSPKRRLGLRREGLILLPVSMLALIAVSFFTLISYRSAILRLIEEAQDQALRRAQRLANSIGQAGNPFDAAQLRSRAPDAQGIALLDELGLPLVETGSFPEGNLLRSLTEPPLVTLETYGPERATGDAVVALVPLAESGAARILRLDLPAPTLATQSLPAALARALREHAPSGPRVVPTRLDRP
jgi:hypothetical protein